MVSGQAPRHGKQGFRVIPTEVAASARQDLTSVSPGTSNAGSVLQPQSWCGGCSLTPQKPGSRGISRGHSDRKTCCGPSRNLSLFQAWDLQRSRRWLRPAPAPVGFASSWNVLELMGPRPDTLKPGTGLCLPGPNRQAGKTVSGLATGTHTT